MFLLQFKKASLSFIASSSGVVDSSHSGLKVSNNRAVSTGEINKNILTSLRPEWFSAKINYHYRKLTGNELEINLP